MTRIPTLDGWRAVAIAMVTLHHCSMGLWSNEDAYWANSQTLFGAFGVDLFFGLSGFLITSTLLAERKAAGAISLRGFYWRRCSRILPAYFLVLAAVTAAGLWVSRAEILGCLFFFRNYVPRDVVSFTTQPLWSLAVEEHFYLLWPAILVVAGKWGKAAAGVLALAFGLWRMIESQAGLGLFPMTPPHFRTDLRLDALFWGAVVAFLVAEAAGQFEASPWLWLTLAALAIVCTRFYSMLSSVLLAFLIPAILAATSLHPRWLASRVLELPGVTWLGRISYGLYLWQGFFLVPLWESPAHWWLRFPFNVVAVLAMAAASYYWVEEPIRRWCRGVGGIGLSGLGMNAGPRRLAND